RLLCRAGFRADGPDRQLRRGAIRHPRADLRAPQGRRPMTQIRAMTEQDVPAVSRFMGESWRRTYGPIIGEDEAARLSGENHSPESLAADLSDTDRMSFVA